MAKDFDKLSTDTLIAHSGKNPIENHGIPAPPYIELAQF